MYIEIQGRRVGDSYPVFFIAEAGVNHNGSLELAKKMVDIAAEAGADAVKFQTFNTEKIILPQAPKASYHVETTGSDHDQSWFNLLKTQEMNRQMHEELIAHSQKRGIIFLSTPYDEESVDLLDELGVPAFKIASTDANNLPFLRFIAGKKKPILLSTAMCTMEEVAQAVGTIRGEGLEEIIVLQCTGNYPACLSDSNLRVICTYRESFNCLVGYSDHVPGLINPIAATALGACVYEKHFTIDKALPGPDHRMSLSPMELEETIRVIRMTEKALGSPSKQISPAEEENRIKLRKSLVAKVGIPRGAALTWDLITSKRPGTGISPSRIEEYIGRKALIDIPVNTILRESMFD
jgi:N,N'-diacetyllegionaminate synthase